MSVSEVLSVALVTVVSGVLTGTVGTCVVSVPVISWMGSGTVVSARRLLIYSG